MAFVFGIFDEFVAVLIDGWCLGGLIVSQLFDEGVDVAVVGVVEARVKVFLQEVGEYPEEVEGYQHNGDDEELLHAVQFHITHVRLIIGNNTKVALLCGKTGIII